MVDGGCLTMFERLPTWKGFYLGGSQVRSKDCLDGWTLWAKATWRHLINWHLWFKFLCSCAMWPCFSKVPSKCRSSLTDYLRTYGTCLAKAGALLCCIWLVLCDWSVERNISLFTDLAVQPLYFPPGSSIISPRRPDLTQTTYVPYIGTYAYA